MRGRVRFSALALRLVVGLEAFFVGGCQLVAPLPTGGDGGAASTAAEDASSSGASSGSAPQPPCGDTACSAYCEQITGVCVAAEQYPSAASCCAACAELGPSCRVAPAKDDLDACSAAGPAGAPGTSCSIGCGAVCQLFASACGDLEMTAVGKCPSDCASAPYDGTYWTCDEGPLSCRLTQVLLALGAKPDKRKDYCHRAAALECPKCD